jgi:hypothetical protein
MSETEEPRAEWHRGCAADAPDAEAEVRRVMQVAVDAALETLGVFGVPAEKVFVGAIERIDPLIRYVFTRGAEGEKANYVFRTCVVVSGGELFLASSWLPAGLARLPMPGLPPKGEGADRPDTN